MPYLYLFFGLSWILLSDFYFSSQKLTFEQMTNLQTLKGVIFVLVTFILFLLLVRKNKEVEKIEEEKKKLTTLINAMPDFVLFKDAEGKWIQVNDFGRDLFELQNIDYQGKTDRDLALLVDFYRDAFNYCSESDEFTWKQRTVSRVDEVIPIRDGTNKTFDVIKVPLFHPDGSRKAFIVIGRDITEQKKTEFMLRKYEKLTVVGELAAGIAHEIRNPLTSLKGFLQLMEEQDETRKLYRKIMISEIDRINDIVTELLMLSKPEDVDFDEQNISSIVFSVYSLLTSEASLKNINISIENKLNHPYVKGSSVQLKQVLINVIKNAIEAIDINGHINLTLANSTKNQLVIKVEDDGCGIDENRLKTIGEPFFTTKEKGFGLGMTVSYKIVKEHKGDIIITSKKDVGTKVSIILPTITKG